MAMYTNKMAGPYKISVTVKGTNILGSPYYPTTSAAAISARGCTAFGTAISKIPVANNAFFTVQAKDTFGNALKMCDASPFNNWKVAATMSGHSAGGSVDSCYQGLYAMSYNASQPGPYSIAVSYAGTGIQGSPFSCTVN
eukprot:NODE_6070_length_882_cov_167.743083_g5840_i0.p1 GENE.NODE_6070_length_882_cov_167.743083_g5840_i0~~NODE_6070_length_882_cov_167.743083_g5840_i0.p1  ORF type:complete len:140 (-),score=33.17 NODE_6070_length_882_cov_167.743083_g5840_i0:133-552(-)